MLVCFGSARAQFTDSTTGLLQMPTADMQENGTFMASGVWLNKHSLPASGWGYNTFSYGINITFWSRFEVGYVCTIFDGKRKPNPTARDKIMFNQDRHFIGRFQLLKEGEFGVDWIPSLVVGVSDPATGSGGGYSDRSSVDGSGNGYFNRNYLVVSKHFSSPWGIIGAHLGYQFNKRKDYLIKAPCAGVDWTPIWIKDFYCLDSLRLVAEFDSRTFNMGFIASLFDNRLEAMFELQRLSWVNFGLRYKLRLR